MILIQVTRVERQGANKMKRRLSKMKRTQKALSLALILCMLLGMALATVLTVFAETSTPATPPVTQWVNNEGKPLTTSSTGM